MGKYATYRKRGTYAPTEPSLPPPPPPELYESDGDLITDATGNPDLGGTLTLYLCNSTGGDRILDDQVAWCSPMNWGSVEDLSDGYYIATETGNGIVYAGESEGSLIYDHDV